MRKKLTSPQLIIIKKKAGEFTPKEMWELGRDLLVLAGAPAPGKSWAGGKSEERAAATGLGPWPCTHPRDGTFGVLFPLPWPWEGRGWHPKAQRCKLGRAELEGSQLPGLQKSSCEYLAKQNLLYRRKNPAFLWAYAVILLLLLY